MSDHDPQLYFAEDGAPRSARFGDIYYSLQDGLSEARAVFLAGCHLPEAWQDGGAFSVLELGFGTGLNIAALINLWAGNRPADGHLHVFSIEGFLMARDQAAAALGSWPEIAEFTDAILEQWPKARRGFHYMDFPQWGVSVTLALMDVRAALQAWSGAADAIFLDGFSPALNADMWGEDVLALVATKARPGTRLATFTVAGFVRRGLQAAGFTVEKRPGFGRKRERLEAVFAPDAPRTATPAIKRIAIVGAGIAGAALAYQARQLGLMVDIYDQDGVGAGASGNAAALVTPRFDLGDDAIAGLFADALDYATRLYRRLAPEAVLAKGTLLYETSPRDAERFDRISRQDVFAQGDIGPFRPGGEATETSGLRLNAALAVLPRPILESLLGDAAIRTGRITGYRTHEAGVDLVMEAASETYDAIILASGDGLIDLCPDLDVRPVRGQIEQAVSNAKPDKPVSWGGYAVPLPDGFLFGATHDRGDRGTDVRDADRARNLESLAKGLPELAAIAVDSRLNSRASIRVTTRDHLPFAGRLTDRVYALGGLGGRGFCLAPLLARALLAEITGGPSGLPEAAKKLLSPDRLRRI